MSDGERTVSTSGNKSILRIYVGRHCWSCEEALRLAAEVKKRFSGLLVDVVDLDNVDSVNYDNVFSVPTYVFNGSTISLGNPTSEELFAKLAASFDSIDLAISSDVTTDLGKQEANDLQESVFE